ncbi:MAG: hypothetical protein SWN10_12485 [Pseudomonadota bacterium]|nr:hypothetical protein [Alteromonas sp.]MDY6927902.1 hypothetical protein [Pseudomonadota bacterium]
METIRALLLTLAMAYGLTACADSKETSPVNQDNAPTTNQASAVYTGTIVYKTFEGGFFAFISTDNKRYTLRHLPKAYRLDGLIVEITGSVNKDIITTTQFGDLLEVDTVKVLDDSHARPPESGPRKLKSL